MVRYVDCPRGALSIHVSSGLLAVPLEDRILRVRRSFYAAKRVCASNRRQKTGVNT